MIWGYPYFWKHPNVPNLGDTIIFAAEVDTPQNLAIFEAPRLPSFDRAIHSWKIGRANYTQVFFNPSDQSMNQRCLNKQTNKQTNKPKQTKTNQNKPKQTKTNQNKPKQTKTNQNKPKQTKTKQNKTNKQRQTPSPSPTFPKLHLHLAPTLLQSPRDGCWRRWPHSGHWAVQAAVKRKQRCSSRALATPGGETAKRSGESYSF